MASWSSATILVSQTILGDEQCMQLAWNELKLGRSKKINKRWMMVFFVMERKKTDVLLQPWASSRPRLAGASQVVFIMRQSRIQILGCGCSPHLADWMRRCATSRRWEVRVQKIHSNVSFWNSIFAPVSSLHRRNSSHVCVWGGGSEPDALWGAMNPRSRLQYIYNVTTMLRNTSHQRYTRRTCTFYNECADVGGFHFTNVHCTAQRVYVCEWHFYCTAMLLFGLHGFHPFLLGTSFLNFYRKNS